MNSRDAHTPPTDEQALEQTLQEKGLVYPRVTPEQIDSLIDLIQYFRPTGTLTICVLTLKNGFNVTGESACVDPRNFNEQIGQDIAYRNARDKIWSLEGYHLASKIQEELEESKRKQGLGFLGRLKNEFNELQERTEKLEAFLETENFQKLDDENRSLLNRQIGLMQSYRDTLSRRIEILDDKP